MSNSDNLNMVSAEDNLEKRMRSSPGFTSIYPFSLIFMNETYLYNLVGEGSELLGSRI
jgi:hypothetical protein